MVILGSIEWDSAESVLLRQSKGLSYEREVKKLIRNTRAKVTELSKAEVDFRRCGNSGRVKQLLAEINEDINMVEEFILVAALIG
jgi:acetolactate synthase small subunit